MPQLDPAQIATYYRQGHLLLPQLVDPEDCRAVLDHVRLPAGASGDWTPRCFDFGDLDRDRELHALLIHPAVVAVTQQLLEDTARVFFGMVAMVPAGGGRGLPWHADNMYSKVLGRALNVFIALDDIAPEQAGLWIAPGSHRHGTGRSHAVSETNGHRVADLDPDEAIQLPAMRAGDACIFDRDTVHRSLRNQTDRHRYAYAAQYAEARARLWETGERIGGKPLVSELEQRWSALPAAG